MRIAIVDLLFSWPPHGGADVDVYHVVSGLSKLGHEPCVFVTHDPSAWERGHVVPAAMPFNVCRLDFAAGTLSSTMVTARIKEAVHLWRPDLVMLTQGYFLKPALIHALASYPVINRCYAHEVACHKDILRFRNGKPCPHAYANTPDRCRRCALKHLGAGIKGGTNNAWTQEYLEAKAWTGEYHAYFLEAMRQLHAVIITTEHMREQVNALCNRIHVIPHGVDVVRFSPATPSVENQPPVILAPGRIEDAAKGFNLLFEAAQRLADKKYKFELHATLPEGHGGPEWLKSLGKRDYNAMPGIYQRADICVVPSVWDEPFGIVAVEAMACGLPVCAARAGGLQDTVQHEKTGLLFNRGDVGELTACLEKLLIHTEWRRVMGEAARQRACDLYSWDVLISRHYPPLFEGIGG